MNSPSRHIDIDAVMLWKSLRKLGSARADELVEYWRPTYSEMQVQDVMQRLRAAGYASCVGVCWHVTGTPPGVPEGAMA